MTKKPLIFRLTQALFLEHEMKCESLGCAPPSVHHKIGCSICDLVDEGWQLSDLGREAVIHMASSPAEKNGEVK